MRVTISPRNFVYFDLSRRYFKLPKSNGIGEPIITRDMIYLPIHEPDDNTKPTAEKIAWDSNMLSFDGYSPETGWIRIDTKTLATIHISSFEKRRSVQRKASKSKKARRELSKYSRRERNRARKHQLEVARVVKSLAKVNRFERLRKEKMYSRSKTWNRRIMRTDWRSIMRRVDGSVELPPQHTSDTCSRCGWANKDLNGGIFRCGSCGLTIDRQLIGNGTTQTKLPLDVQAVYSYELTVNKIRYQILRDPTGTIPRHLIGQDLEMIIALSPANKTNLAGAPFESFQTMRAIRENIGTQYPAAADRATIRVVEVNVGVGSSQSIARVQPAEIPLESP